MNITKFILICADVDTPKCQFDCIYKTDPNASCFSSEKDLLKLYRGIAKIRGEDPKTIIIKKLRELIKQIDEELKED